MRTFRLAAAYFALVFGTGFVLGIFRTLWLVPRLGIRTSELLEMPFMFFALVLAARWISRRIGATGGGQIRVRIGVLAFALSVAAEVGFGVVLRKVSPMELLLDRDPVSGTAYYVLLVIFAAMPWFYWRFIHHDVA
jgi:hypothetical protein